MQRYTSKDDLYGQICGIETYQPGDSSARHLAIGVSSGTTKGKPTLVVYTRENSRGDNAYLRQTAMYGKRASVLRLSMSTQNTHKLITEIWSASQPKQLCVVTKDDMKKETFSTLITEFAPTQISGQPSFLLHMLTMLQEKNAQNALTLIRDQVTAVECAGEKITDTQMHALKHFLPQATFYNDYSLSEMRWYFASTCPVRPPRDTSIFCIASECSDMVDIKDADENGTGEIVVTTPELGSYRTGDMGRIEAQECVCGSRKKLTVIGRMNYDIVQCVGATFLISEIDRVFEALHAHVTDYLVEVTEVTDEHATVRGKVHLTVVPRNLLKHDPIATQTIRAAFEGQLFVTPSRTLKQLIDKNVFAQTDVFFTNEIPRQNKKIRLRRI